LRFANNRYAKPGPRAKQVLKMKAAHMKPRVLFVDDDSRALASYRRHLDAEFDLTLETDSLRALERIAQDEPYVVIVSDLKMPGMDGVTLLGEAAKARPDTVRILLTGYADFKNAVDAVNKGFVFRFLSKPCSPEDLKRAVWDGVRQNELIKDGYKLYSLQKMKDLMDGVVEGLSTLVEVRDPYTAGHQRRVAELACAIGARMGFAPDRLEALRVAGILHDIGKIYVPSDFLNKPGRLNEQEFSIIKMHPEIGADILKSVRYDWPISDYIRQHHERMDGSGYPDGLKGEEILLEARILAVSDVIDAMRSLRPYRAGLGLPAAVEEISAQAGTLYDPDVAQRCLAILAENPDNMTSGV
jgi:putative two-component system response regulator